MRKRLVKGIPITTLVLASLIIIGAGAVLVALFSGSVSHSIEIRGLDGQLVQSGAHGNYMTKAAASTLADQMHGASNAVTYATDSVIVVVNTENLVDEDLILSIAVYDTGTTDPASVSWTASPEYVEFAFISGDGSITPDGSPTAINATSWTIAYADIQGLYWEDISGLAAPDGQENALIISFSFGTEYAAHGAGFGNMDYDIVIEMNVDA